MVKGSIAPTPAQPVTPATSTGQPAGTASAASQGPQRPVIDRDIEAMMKEDVEEVVGALRQQWVDAEDEARALRRVQKWAMRDDDHRARTGYAGSDYLDRFLFLLKMRTYSQRTARAAWIEQWTSAYDALWYELEDERLETFKSLVARSKKQGTAAGERLESAWSFVGKREAMGGWGVLKGMGTTLAGLADLALWTQGIEIREGGVAGAVGRQFDETAKIISEWTGVDPSEQLFGGFSLYGFGTTGGKVIGGLTLAGAMPGGGAGQVVGAAQTLKAAEDLGTAIAKLRQGPPPMSWSAILKRPDVWAQIVGVVGGAIGVAGGFAEAESALADTFKALGISAGTTQTALLIAAYRAIDDDPTIPPAERQQRKEDLLAEILTTGAITIDARYGENFKEAWEAQFNSGRGQVELGGTVPTPKEQEALPHMRHGEVELAEPTVPAAPPAKELPVPTPPVLEFAPARPPRPRPEPEAAKAPPEAAPEPEAAKAPPEAAPEPPPAKAPPEAAPEPPQPAATPKSPKVAAWERLLESLRSKRTALSEQRSNVRKKMNEAAEVARASYRRAKELADQRARARSDAERQHLSKQIAEAQRKQQEAKERVQDLHADERSLDRDLARLDKEIKARSKSLFKREERDLKVDGKKPEPPNNGKGRVGSTPAQQQALEADLAQIQGRADDIRVDQTQVNADKEQVGINRPDLQYILGGKRYYIEYEQPHNPRGLDHARRILKNDPEGIVIVKLVPTEPGAPIKTKEWTVQNIDMGE